MDLTQKVISMNVIIKAKQAKRESQSIESKGRFDPTSAREWCEILKDLVAISNSGGGAIIAGLHSDGIPSQDDISEVIAIDPASISDQVLRYTRIQFSSFEIFEDTKDGWPILILKIDASVVPMVFTKPGTYEIDGTKRQQQRTAFSQGQVYFRHGAKSEPGNSEALGRVIERNLKNTKKAWLDGVKKVTAAPNGSIFSITPRDIQENPSSDSFRVRVVDDPDAPGFRPVSPDESHPYRQSELIDLAKLSVPDGTPLNSYEFFMAKELYRIHENEDFCYRHKYGSPQYSDACLQWFFDNLSNEPGFFKNARDAYREVIDQVEGED